MTNPLAQDLGGVVLLPCPFCGAENAEVQKWLWWVQCNECDSNGPAKATEAEAITAWNTRAHSAEIAGALRDADGWQPIESAPSEVPADDAVLVCVTYDEPRFASQRIVGEAYKIDGIWWWAGTHPDQYVTDPIEDSYGIDCVTHWRPLPAPPTQDSAMQQGGGGG